MSDNMKRPLITWDGETREMTEEEFEDFKKYVSIAALVPDSE
jgi:hypothetical protein